MAYVAHVSNRVIVGKLKQEKKKYARKRLLRRLRAKSTFPATDPPKTTSYQFMLLFAVYFPHAGVHSFVSFRVSFRIINRMLNSVTYQTFLFKVSF